MQLPAHNCNVTIPKERSEEAKSVTKQKQALRTDTDLMQRVRNINHYDIKLYQRG